MINYFARKRLRRAGEFWLDISARAVNAVRWDDIEDALRRLRRQREEILARRANVRSQSEG